MTGLWRRLQQQELVCVELTCVWYSFACFHLNNSFTYVSLNPITFTSDISFSLVLDDISPACRKNTSFFFFQAAGRIIKNNVTTSQSHRKTSPLLPTTLLWHSALLQLPDNNKWQRTHVSRFSDRLRSLGSGLFRLLLLLTHVAARIHRSWHASTSGTQEKFCPLEIWPR